MKKIIFLTTILSFLSAAFFSALAQIPDCKKYHNGTFKIMADGKTVIIKRYGARQEEYVNNMKVPVVYSVKWKNDCTYVLTPTKATLAQHFPGINKKTVLTVEMVQQNTASYTQLVSAPYTTAKTTSEVYPVK